MAQAVPSVTGVAHLKSPVTDLLDPLVNEPALDALEAWLLAAPGDDLAAASAWAKQRAATDVFIEYRPDEPDRMRWDRAWIGPLIQAAALPPVEAVKRLPFRRWPHVPLGGTQFDRIVRVLRSRPRAWAEHFVPGAAEVRTDSPFALFYMLDVLIRDHGLPVPEGDGFLEGWARRGPNTYQWSGIGERVPTVPEADLADPLYTPALFGALLRSPHLRHRPGLAISLAELERAGLTRARVLGLVFEALTTPSSAASQRALAKFWNGLAPTDAELADRLPLLQSALATCHGSLTHVLTPRAVGLAASEADLIEIVRTVAARPEKQQQVDLIRSLEQVELHDRLGRDAIVGAAGEFAGVQDAALRDRAEKLRLALGEGRSGTRVASSEEQSGGLDEGLWSPLPCVEVPRASVQIPVEISHRKIRMMLGDQSGTRAYGFISDGRHNWYGEALLLECLVRVSRGGQAEQVRAWLPPPDDRMWAKGWQPLAGAIVSWLQGDLEAGPVYDGVVPWKPDHGHAHHWAGIRALLNAATREVLARAGTLTTVLSTPSHTDGTLSTDAFVERVVSGAVTHYTPHDLLLALLRLPADPGEVRDLDGLHLPVDEAIWSEHVGNAPVEAPDGIELFRRWIESGGLRPLDARFELGQRGHSGYPQWLMDPRRLPYPAEVFADLNIDPSVLFVDVPAEFALVVAPAWPDLAATYLGSRQERYVATPLLGSSGPLGVPSHAKFLAPTVGDVRDRARAADGLLALVEIGKLSEVHLREAVDKLNRVGRLPLGRLAEVFEQAFMSGGLADLWQAALGVADDAVLRRPRPGDLPAFLRMLTAYAPAVPVPVLPTNLARLATERGATKSHAEARTLMAACERSTRVPA